MSSNRVQKLLFSEYCDFEDMVLIESPFAQTTKDGNGIRQVHLGLTPSKLILATDVLPPVNSTSFTYIPGTDPEIETFELIAIYPVECVNLSVYCRKRRQALKARFCNSKVLYFELGGFEKRNMFWNLWIERVKFLCPGDSNSSRSETSVATSSTGSSLYLLDKRYVKANGIRQLWCKFGPNLGVSNELINSALSNTQSLLGRWPDRNLYLGKDYVESPLEYRPLSGPLTKEDLTKTSMSRSNEVSPRKVTPTQVEEKNLHIGDSIRINRFGAGIPEGCHTGLYLTVDDYIPPRHYSEYFETVESVCEVIQEEVNYYEIADQAVLLWEFYNLDNPDKFKTKHRRRYGLLPISNFEYGLGPQVVSPNYTLHLKRTSSEVNLRSSFEYSELKMPFSKNELISTISCPFLSDEKQYNTTNIMSVSSKKQAILFWTTDYWYRPISPKDRYTELQRYIRKVREYHDKTKNLFKRKRSNRKFLRKFYSNKEKYSEEDDNDDFYNKYDKKRKSSFIYSMFGSKVDEISDMDSRRKPDETSFQHLKRLIGADVAVCAWDFDSTTLAQQLTMIDKQLFLKITVDELEVLTWQRSSRNAPNVVALLGFSHRISCLIATEILKDDTERMRARLMARFINVANKCHRISNFQTCKTVLSGLQSPAIYRLKKTWAYVRKKHASKYQLFEYLCRLYRDPRMPTYQKTFFIFSQAPPFLPYIGDVISRLLNKIPEYQFHKFRRPISRQISAVSSKTAYSKSMESLHQASPNLLSKILKVLVPGCDPIPGGGGDCRKRSVQKNTKKQPFRRKSTKFKGLYEYYKPLGCYEDLRAQGLGECTQFLERCQLGAVHYSFNSNDLAQSYLLRARYIDAEKNFYKSLTVESVQNNNVRNKKHK